MISAKTIELFYSPIWRERSLGADLTEDEIVFFNEVSKEIQRKSIIVFGCGNGREFSYASDAEFYGVDFTRKYLDEARRRHPKANLVLAALEMLPFREETQFDLGLTSAVLQHIPHEAIRGVVENIQNLCKAVMIKEGAGVLEKSYQFNHDYIALFKPMKLRKQKLLGTNPWTTFFFFTKEDSD